MFLSRFEEKNRLACDANYEADAFSSSTGPGVNFINNLSLALVSLFGALLYMAGGISLGSVYAIIALGYTMVYGIAKMLNFAHGDIIMVGAYAVVTSVLTLGLPPLVAILISIAICALLGITVEFLAYRPLRQAPPLAVLITAIGVSYLLQNLALLIYGSEQKAFPVLFTIPSMELGGVYIDGITIATTAVTAIIMVPVSR